MKSTVEVLRKARALIEDPERWTRGWFARNAEGEMTDALDPEAMCWCGIGAVIKAAGTSMEAIPAQFVLDDRPAGFTALNDGPVVFEDGEKWTNTAPRAAPARHKKVLAAFDRAIAKAEAES